MEPCSSVKNTALRIKERIKRLCVRNKQNENEFSCYMPSHFIDKRNMKMVKIRKDRFQSNILIRATLDNFSEEGYLAANIDVQQAVTNHFIKSGYDHFINHGKKENRLQYIHYDLKSGNELEIQKMYFENVHLQIDTNSACNLMCRTCPRGVRVMKNERKFMDYSLFKSIIDKAKINNIRSLEMHNWTEPFLHPQLTEFAAYAKAKDFSVCISSNLALPNISHLAAILQEIDTLYVSVSGFTQATYSINHKCGKIDNVKNNLEKIIQIMEKTSFTPNVIIKYLEFSYNKAEFFDFEKFIKGSPIKIEHIDASGDPLDTRLKQHYEKLNNQSIQHLSKIFCKNIMQRRGKVCRNIYYAIPIDCSGNVHLCCFLPNFDYTKIGHFLDLDLATIQYLRQAHPSCLNCKNFHENSCEENAYFFQTIINSLLLEPIPDEQSNSSDDASI